MPPGKYRLPVKRAKNSAAAWLKQELTLGNPGEGSVKLKVCRKGTHSAHRIQRTSFSRRSQALC